jgi:RNA polymerase sigma factor (TIGR02999 family)
MAEAELRRLILSAETGDAGARERLFVALYNDLHGLAQSQLRRSAAVTLSPTTLLHETFLNISQRESAAFADRAQFMAYAARAMRGLIIDYVRNRKAQKRGGGFEITALSMDVAAAPVAGPDFELETMSEALEALAAVDERLANVVDLRFFCGFSFEEIGELLGTSKRTAQRDWEKARIFLHRFVKDRKAAL